ncbi:MAG: alpha/beta hydrolase [Allosphingosinicella sp.]
MGLATALSAALLTFACGPAHTAGSTPPAPEVLRLWPGPAPGSESWTGPEEEADADIPGAGRIHVVTNVTIPTVTVFRPPAGRASGTAMLVLPGGAFRALAWDLDGTEVAQWLAARGITAFVLRYRVRPPGASAPSGAETLDAFLLRTRPARDIAVADAQQALRQIRSSADRYGIKADRVGAIGASAGAMTVLDLALAPDPAARPDFAVAESGAIPPEAGPATGAPPFVHRRRTGRPAGVLGEEHRSVRALDRGRAPRRASPLRERRPRLRDAPAPAAGGPMAGSARSLAPVTWARWGDDRKRGSLERRAVAAYPKYV